MASHTADTDASPTTGVEPTDADTADATAAWERPPDEPRAPGYEQRKRAAVTGGRAIGHIPGGVAFLKLFHLSIKLLYPPLRLLGRLTRQSDRIERWIAESEEVMATYYAGARGENPLADAENATDA